MKSKIILTVDDLQYLDDYREVGVTTFLFPLKGFSVGYNDYTLEEINKANVSNKYILLNRVLDCIDIDKLKTIIKDIKGIKGIFFEDIGAYQVLKDLDLELILFQNHFNCNIDSVNFWLDRVNSVVISNELTYKELEYITDNVKKDVVLHLYGYNQVMYSRRKLLTNFTEEFKLKKREQSIIEDKATHVRFRAIESEYGTVMYSDKIFNGNRLLNLKHVKYFYVNSMMIKHEKLLKYLDSFNSLDQEEDEGFLDKETIYKLKER